jgi:hypothetical protein
VIANDAKLAREFNFLNKLYLFDSEVIWIIDNDAQFRAVHRGLYLKRSVFHGGDGQVP